MADNRTIGEKLRATEDRVRGGDVPDNRPSNKEKAEGSRENVNTGRGSNSEPDMERGGGISNRPRGDERREQHSVPPRGSAKEGGHA